MAPNAKVSCDSNQATASRRVGARVCLSNSSSHRVEKRTNANLGVFQGPLNFCWKEFEAAAILQLVIDLGTYLGFGFWKSHGEMGLKGT